MTSEPRPGPRSVEAIARLLSVDLATGQVTWSDEAASARQMTHQELSLWLYTRLHARNPKALSGATPVRDPALEARIIAAADDPGVLVPCTLRDDIDLPGQLVAVEVHRIVLAVEAHDVRDGSAVILPSHRPNLTPGFLMFIHESPTVPSSGSPTRHYIPGADAETALEIWRSTMGALLTAGLSFRAKMLSDFDSYPRSDALVVYSWHDSTEVESVLTATLGGAAPSHPGSVLCREVAPSLFTAVSPAPVPGKPEQSYGEHRANAIATAVLEYLADEGFSLEQILKQVFEREGIDLADAARSAVRVAEVLA